VVERPLAVAPRPPVRLVHLGLGAFHRAHQAWYTHHANRLSGPEDQWGYASMTGRSPRAAELLGRQGNEYNIVTRHATRDTTELIRSIVISGDGADRAALHDLLSAQTTALVTLTVTEAGYRLGADGGLNLEDPDVRGDLDSLRSGSPAPVATAAARLVDGLAHRRRSCGHPIAIVSCDNLGNNGDVASRIVSDFAEELDPALARWIAASVSFVSTMVDRITPATDLSHLAVPPMVNGVPDAMAVVTEPFTEWILAGDFPLGRPAWERAGARFVADVRPYEQRKLLLLNAGHSLLAYLGPLYGHATVADAMSDARCGRALEELWDEAALAVALPAGEIAEARAAVRRRFQNPRIVHRLDQIGRDGSHKLRVRCMPVVRYWLGAGKGMPPGETRLLAAWLVALRLGLTLPSDPAEEALAALTATDVRAGVRRMLELVAADLAGSEPIISAVSAAIARLELERAATERLTAGAEKR
jgi:fructuronate reductase